MLLGTAKVSPPQSKVVRSKKMKNSLKYITPLIAGIIIGAVGGILLIRHANTMYKLESPYEPPRHNIIESISGIDVGGISFLQGAAHDSNTEHKILAKVRVVTPANYPVVYVYNANAGYTPNSLSIWDSSYRNFTIVDDNNDGRWDYFEYSTGLSSNDTRFIDLDMNGHFDKETKKPKLPVGEIYQK